jgi:hypothetical protein
MGKAKRGQMSAREAAAMADKAHRRDAMKKAKKGDQAGVRRLQANAAAQGSGCLMMMAALPFLALWRMAMGWGSKRDPAPGRKKRENTRREARGTAPQRWNGKIVRKGRLEFKRAKAQRRPRRWI